MTATKIKRQIILTLTQDENSEINQFLKENPVRITPLTQHALLRYIRDQKSKTSI